MKIITYVKKENGEPYIKVEHEIRVGYSVREEFEYWRNLCIKTMNKGIIVDYQVELIL